MNYVKNNFKTNIKISHIFLYLLLGLFTSILINSLLIKFGLIKFKLESSDIDAIYYYIAMFIRIITSCLIGPFLEELLYRGILYNFLAKRMNIILAAILTTMIFSISHISLIQCIFALLTGIIFIVFYIKTKNLLVTFLIHSSINVASLFAILFKTNYLFILLYVLLFIVLLFICYNFKEDKTSN